MRITKKEMDRRKRLAAANTAIWNAMDSVTKEHGEFTTAEWLKVFNDTSGRLIRYELSDEIPNPVE
jgi:hypothetical protein